MQSRTANIPTPPPPQNNSATTVHVHGEARYHIGPHWQSPRVCRQRAAGFTAKLYQASGTAAHFINSSELLYVMRWGVNSTCSVRMSWPAMEALPWVGETSPDRMPSVVLFPGMHKPKHQNIKNVKYTKQKHTVASSQHNEKRTFYCTRSTLQTDD